MPRPVQTHEVIDVEGSLAREQVGALFFKRNDLAQDGASRGARDLTVFGLKFIPAFVHNEVKRLL